MALAEFLMHTSTVLCIKPTTLSTMTLHCQNPGVFYCRADLKSIAPPLRTVGQAKSLGLFGDANAITCHANATMQNKC